MYSLFSLIVRFSNSLVFLIVYPGLLNPLSKFVSMDAQHAPVLMFHVTVYMYIMAMY